jgi:hypothetical protein
MKKKSLYLLNIANQVNLEKKNYTIYFRCILKAFFFSLTWVSGLACAHLD